MEGLPPRRAFALSDIPWTIVRLLRKGTIVSLPIAGHLTVARLRGSFYQKFRTPSATVRENLRIALNGKLKPSEIERVARQYYAFSKRLYLWRILPLHPGFRSRSWPIRGLENLEHAVKSNRGVILVTAHLGYPHIIPAVLSTQGYEVRQVVAEIDRVEKNRSIEEWLERTTKLRKAVYNHTRVFMGQLGPRDLVASFDVRPILAALSNKEIVMIAGDGLRSTQFIELSLFERPYPFPTGFIRIAEMTDATVIPVFAVPDEEGKNIRVEIHEPLLIRPGQTLAENIQLFAQVLGDKLNSTPHLWHRWDRPNWFGEARDWAGQVASKDPFKSRRKAPKGPNRTIGRLLASKVRRAFRADAG